MQKMLIIGATSAIAEQVARLMCNQVDMFYLLGRDENKTRAVAEDLSVRGANVQYKTADFSAVSDHAQLIEAAISYLGNIDIVLIAYGTLPNQLQCEKDSNYALNEIHTNFVSVVSLLTSLVTHMETQGRGKIAVISSVAGERGRQSNYVYGSAKAGLSVYLQGLRNRLVNKNIHVLTIKPGFVDTPMTREFRKGLLWVGPDKVAQDIVKALDKCKDVLYTPWYWQWIMLIIKLIPERIFKKMKL